MDPWKTLNNLGRIRSKVGMYVAYAVLAVIVLLAIGLPFFVRSENKKRPPEKRTTGWDIAKIYLVLALLAGGVAGFLYLETWASTSSGKWAQFYRRSQGASFLMSPFSFDD